MRFLADGIQEWATSIAKGSGPVPFVGVLEGGAGQGTGALLSALEHVATERGIQFFGTTFSPRPSTCAEPIADLIEPFVRARIDEQLSAPTGGDEPSGRRRVLDRLGADLRIVFPELAFPENIDVPRPHEPAEDRLRRIDALAQSLVELAGRRPTVIALQNVDACDELSAEVIRHFLRILRRRSGAGSPVQVLAVLTASAGELPAFPELEDRRHSAFHIHLRGYSREDLQETARRTFHGDLSVSARESLHRLTRGDARLVHWLLERTQASGGDSSALLDLEGDFESIARDELSKLDADDRQIVEAITAFGFPVDLEELSDWIQGFGIDAPELSDPDTLLEVLAKLESGHWIRSAGTVASRRWYVETDIASAVVQESGKERMSLRVREAARVLLARCGGIGRQAVRAWRLAGICRNGSSSDSLGPASPAASIELDDVVELSTEGSFFELGDVAAQYLESLGACSETLDVLETVLTSLDADDRAAVQEIEGRVLALLEETGNHREALEIVRSRYDSCESPESSAANLRKSGDLQGRLSNPSAQLDAYRRGLKILQDRSTDEAETERVRLLSRLARGSLDSGDVESCRESCDAALTILESRTSFDEGDRRELLIVLARSFADTADRVTAIALEERVYESFHELGDAYGQIACLRRIGELFSREGERARARECWSRALELAENSGVRRLEAKLLRHLGESHGDARSYDEAFRLLERAWAILDEFGDSDGLASIEANLVECEFRTGRFKAGARTVMRCVERRFECPCNWPLKADGSADGADLDEVKRQRARELQRQSELESRLHRGRDALAAEEVFELVELWTQAGRLVDAQRLLEASVGREAFKANADVRARSVQGLGKIAALRGDVDLALKSYEESLRPRFGLPSSESVAVAYLEVGAILLRHGHIVRAFDYTLRGWRLAWDEGVVDTALDGLLRVADLLIDVSQFRAAVVVGSAAANLARSCGLWTRELLACCCAGRASRSIGHERAARRAFTRARELDRVLGSPLASCTVALEGGWDYFRLRDYSAAADAAARGSSFAADCGALWFSAPLRHLAGAVEGCSSNPHNNLLRALDVLDHVARDAERQDYPRLAWDVSLCLEQIYISRGKPEVADTLRRRAEAAWTVCFSALPGEWASLVWTSRSCPGVAGEKA